MKLVSIRRAKE